MLKTTALMAAVCIGCLATRAVAGSDTSILVESNPGVPFLQCVAVRPKPAPPAAPAVPHEPTEVVPDDDELADLPPLAPAVRRQIDAALLSGFALSRPGFAGRSLRIGIWGDSHVAAAPFSRELARVVEASTSSRVQVGYLPATMSRAGVQLPIRKHCIGKSWQLEPAYNSKTQPVTVGPSLVNLRSTANNSYLWLDFREGDRPSRVRRIRILYVPTTASSAVAVRVDDGQERELVLPRTSGASETAAVVVEATGPISTIKLRVIQGTLLLEGFSVDYYEPAAVIMDVFGVPSATARGWAQVDTDFLKSSLRGSTYDAAILEYGTNEGAVGRFDRDAYAEGLRSALQNFREVFPEAACLLIGPADRGTLVRRVSSKARRQAQRTEKTDLLKYAAIHQDIASIQADIAPAFRCAS